MTKRKRRPQTEDEKPSLLDRAIDAVAFVADIVITVLFTRGDDD